MKGRVMYFRDRVEEMMIVRLCKQTDTDKEVTNEEFNELTHRLDSMIKWIARSRKITGFTDDDFKSFMYLKVHQILRRDLYDPKKSHYRFFIKVFNNLFNDINRCKDRAIKQLDQDGLDNCMTYDDRIRYTA